MNPIRTALAATTALVASSSFSFANVISQTQTFSGSTNWGTSTNTTSFSPTQTLNFAGFNPSLGSLNSVTITFKDTINGTLTLQNNGSTTTSVTASLSNVGKASLPSFTKTLNAFSNSVTQSLTSHGSFGPAAAAGTTQTSKIITSGLGVFEVPWAALVGDLGNLVLNAGTGNGTATYTDNGTISIIATYDYTLPPPPNTTSTPEPASMAALGSGLLGLGVLRRRKKN